MTKELIILGNEFFGTMYYEEKIGSDLIKEFNSFHDARIQELVYIFRLQNKKVVKEFEFDFIFEESYYVYPGYYFSDGIWIPTGAYCLFGRRKNCNKFINGTPLSYRLLSRPNDGDMIKIHKIDMDYLIEDKLEIEEIKLYLYSILEKAVTELNESDEFPKAFNENKISSQNYVMEIPSKKVVETTDFDKFAKFIHDAKHFRQYDGGGVKYVYENFTRK